MSSGIIKLITPICVNNIKLTVALMRRFFYSHSGIICNIRFEFDNFDKCVRHFHLFSNNKILLNLMVAIIVKVVKVSKCQTACSTL